MLAFRLFLSFSLMVTNIARLAAIEELIFSTRLAKNSLSSCAEKIINESPTAIAKIIEM
jgi:hypothetical protein